ncbi:type 1 glutamine amidotransferase domain-containing protein [Ornithinimicrobium panacihumi]|uniref:type 1 glutamine amidotransferase domain-containing protein n=1 Tax=Ornithinimicrobium panacihumi TaxID=2008449 RepID=UPI003F8A8DA3
MTTPRVLALVTNVSDYQKVGYRTGLWLGELTHFQDVLEKAGYAVDVASPQGGYVPLDPESLSAVMLKMGGTDKRYEDPAYMKTLQHTRAAADVDVADYEAVYLAGGHGTMFDFRDPQVVRLVGAFADAGKVVSAVCHGPAGLLDVTLADGTPLLEGRKVTGFSWREEKVAGRRRAVPFNLEKELGQRGRYGKAMLPMKSHVVVDGTLVTGQNPMSASGVGDEVVKLLKKAAKRARKQGAAMGS